ncbi:Similar to lola: Longitudinals lacking protein [Cotesia congregata]|uniref:Isoforms A/B/D/L (Drosophila melanogaster) n=1 Tax=Cotesia congregata TaxID=51543 RepID=A0A8J2MMG5_COTCN|nr:Similar to lola: Longitudinals lacking protein [Cotesia congregata]
MIWGPPQVNIEVQLHTCPKCARTYSHKCNLMRHLRLECGVGPRFQCSSCEKRFKHRHHLRDHEKLHTHHWGLDTHMNLQVKKNSIKS